MGSGCRPSPERPKFASSFVTAGLISPRSYPRLEPEKSAAQIAARVCLEDPPHWTRFIENWQRADPHPPGGDPRHRKRDCYAGGFLS
jgi:hypothetical protein